MGDAATYPSSNWESQAQPLGNGRIGAMVFGNPLKERIQFNDASLWTGGANPSGGYEVNEFGSYQNFGDLMIEMKAEGTIENFSRTLDLATAIHTTTWKQNGVTFSREVFVSKPDEAIVVRITADQPAKISGNVSLTGAHGEANAVEENGIHFSGSLANGMRQAARLEVVSEGGKTEVAGPALAFTGNSVTLILTAATDYALDPAKNFRSGIDPAATTAKQC